MPARRCAGASGQPLGLRTRWSVGVLATLLALVASAAPQPSHRIEALGSSRSGEPVERVTVSNDRGMQLACIDYGATITALRVPDRNGRLQNVVLSLPDLAAYEVTQRRFAAVIGRYAGRIGAARFSLDGRTFELSPNAKGVALHGDPRGFDRRVWQRRDFAEAGSLGSVFSLLSPADDQHFPGRLDVEVTYRLMRRSNELRIEYAATTDAPTVLNLTNHAYFNLAGAGTRGLGSHMFTLAADRYAVTDTNKLPTGELASVQGTALDFRAPASMAARLVRGNTLLDAAGGYDHSLVFAAPRDASRPVLRVDEWQSGRRLEVWTSEPSAQLNSGNGFDGTEIGAEGLGYGRHDGFAFETQHLPDSPNHAHFPSTTLRPGQVFRSLTRLRFSVCSRPAARPSQAACARP